MNSLVESIISSQSLGSLLPDFLNLKKYSSVSAELVVAIIFAVFTAVLFFYIWVFLSSFFLRSCSISEQNLGNFFDFSGLFVTVAIFFCMFFYVSFFFKAAHHFLLYNLVLPQFILFYVLNIFTVIGFYFCIYIKGSGQGLSILYNFLLDCISTSSFSVRFIIQLIRILILVVTLFLFNIVFLELYFFSGSLSCGSILILYSHIFFEVFHSIFLVFMQSAVFIFILSWLFQFLFLSYSVFLSE